MCTEGADLSGRLLLPYCSCFIRVLTVLHLIAKQTHARNIVQDLTMAKTDPGLRQLFCSVFLSVCGKSLVIDKMAEHRMERSEYRHDCVIRLKYWCSAMLSMFDPCAKTDKKDLFLLTRMATAQDERFVFPLFSQKGRMLPV